MALDCNSLIQVHAAYDRSMDWANLTHRGRGTHTYTSKLGHYCMNSNITLNSNVKLRPDYDLMEDTHTTP